MLIADRKCFALITILMATVYEELRASGKFENMNLSVDEAEHSMEMHLPYIAKVFRGYMSSHHSCRIIIFVPWHSQLSVHSCEGDSMCLYRYIALF